MDRDAVRGAPPRDRGERDRVRNLIARVAFFDGFEGAELDVLATYFRAFEADAGTVVFAEGEASDFLCLLASGAAEVLKEDHQGISRTVATARAGRTLGEMALIDDEPRSATAKLTEPAELLALDKERFERLAAEHPRLALRFVLAVARLMSRRLRQTSGMLVDHLG